MAKATRRFLVALAALLVLAGSAGLYAVPQPIRVMEVPDQEPQRKDFTFSGKWMPAIDPSRIGAENFRTLRNLRPIRETIEGTNGYTLATTAPLATYTDIRDGIQLRKDGQSHILVWAVDPATGQGRVFINKTEVPNDGPFEATPIHTDASPGLTGSLAELPRGAIGYANGRESIIYSGEIMPVGGFYLVNDATLAGAVWYGDQAQSTLSTENETVPIGTKRFALVFVPRALDALHFTVTVANATASALTVKYWSGSGWVDVTGLSDGTSEGGKALAKSGAVSFASTVGLVAPYHFEDFYSYAYLLEWGAGTTATVSQVTSRAPPQPLQNAWDGADRQLTQVQVSRSGKWEDYTLNANEPSSVDYPIGAVLDGLEPSTEFMVVMSLERLSALRLTMVGNLVNTTGGTTVTVQYWSRSGAWVNVSNLVDGTKSGTKALNRSGLVSWNPPAATEEAQHVEYGAIFGTPGFAYKVFWTGGTLSGTAGGAKELVIDLVRGRPAQERVPAFQFLRSYKGRVLGCGVPSENAGNRVDFTATNAPDVWNGSESSRGPTTGPLYFGSENEPLTNGVTLYNRYGSNVFEIFFATSRSRCFQLKGSAPRGSTNDLSEVFSIDTVSDSVGCPAPKTMVVLDGFMVGQDVERKVVMFLDSSGPYRYDGATLTRIPGIENYFDPANSEAINSDLIHLAAGWYDPIYREWNIVFPSGSAAVRNNTWLAFNVELQKWYERATGAAPMPQVGWLVKESSGAHRVYAGIETGHIAQLEDGTSWNGTPIDQVVVTGDIFPTGSIADQTIIREIKIVSRRIPEAHTLAMTYFKDTAAGSGVDHRWISDDSHQWWDTPDHQWVTEQLATVDLSAGSSLTRLVRATSPLNLVAWSHGFGFQVSTTTTERGFQPIGWSIKFNRVRDDQGTTK